MKLLIFIHNQYSSNISSCCWNFLQWSRYIKQFSTWTIFFPVYLTEVFTWSIALSMCAIKSIDNYVNLKNVYICSDSQYAIKSLSNSIVVSSLVKKCRIALAELGRTNTIYIIWVPGHAGVYGNERADFILIFLNQSQA